MKVPKFNFTSSFPSSYSPEKLRLLSSSLPFVPSHGWTRECLNEGSKSIGWSVSSTALCERGPVELVEYFMDKSREDMNKLLVEDESFHKLKTTGKIVQAVQARLRMTQPYINEWPEAVALMLHPTNASHTTRQLAELIDDIWYLAGDRSVDMNWYSKRFLLAGVYTSTELYMTTDASENLEATHQFLERRIADVGVIGRSAADVKNVLSFGASQIVSALRRK